MEVTTVAGVGVGGATGSTTGATVAMDCVTGGTAATDPGVCGGDPVLGICVTVGCGVVAGGGGAGDGVVGG